MHPLSAPKVFSLVAHISLLNKSIMAPCTLAQSFLIDMSKTVLYLYYVAVYGNRKLEMESHVPLRTSNISVCERGNRRTSHNL